MQGRMQEVCRRYAGGRGKKWSSTAERGLDAVSFESPTGAVVKKIRLGAHQKA